MLNHKEIGDQIPEVDFPVRVNNEWKTLSSKELFENQTVILFALPGAFTPTCSSTHLPRYNELAPVFAKLGVDRIICLSVNDTFVMNAWQADQNAEHIEFLPDGNGDFSRGMGMLVSKDDLGFGQRSWRYSMLVKNGVIEKMFVEPNEPGDPFKVSDADTMLNDLSPNAELPKRVTVFSKPGCPHCARAKDLLSQHHYNFEEISLGGQGLSYSSLQAVTGQGTTPQIYIDGQRIGGADDLAVWLGNAN